MNKVDWGTRTREEANMSGRHELYPGNTHLLLPYPYSAVCCISANTAVFLELTCTLIKDLRGRAEPTVQCGSIPISMIWDIMELSLGYPVVRTGRKTMSLHSFPIIFTENIRLRVKEIDFKFHLFKLIHRITGRRQLRNYNTKIKEM